LRWLCIRQNGQSEAARAQSPVSPVHGEPVQGRTDVLVLLLQTGQGCNLLMAVELGGEGLREPGRPLGVSLANPLSFSARLESLQRELANGRKYPDAVVRVTPSADHEQTTCHQRVNAPENVARRHSVARAHLLEGLERASADEYAEATKDDLLDGREQVVAPGNRVAQGLVPGWKIARPPGEDS